jgi:hypothetical protein
MVLAAGQVEEHGYVLVAYGGQSGIHAEEAAVERHGFAGGVAEEEVAAVSFGVG